MAFCLVAFSFEQFSHYICSHFPASILMRKVTSSHKPCPLKINKRKKQLFLISYLLSSMTCGKCLIYSKFEWVRIRLGIAHNIAYGEKLLSGQEGYIINGHEMILSSTNSSNWIVIIFLENPVKLIHSTRPLQKSGEKLLVRDVPGQGIVATHSMRNNQQNKTQCWMSEAH